MRILNRLSTLKVSGLKGKGMYADAQRISQLCWMFFLKIIDDQDQELELMQDGYRSPIPKKYQWRAWAADPEGITGDELMAFVNDEPFPALKTLAASTIPIDLPMVVGRAAASCPSIDIMAE
jgi:type I restriction enzyme M protein